MLCLILQEMLQTFLARGVQVWGQPVQDVLDDGHLLIQQAASQDGPGLVSMLLEVRLLLMSIRQNESNPFFWQGAPNAGKTALAAKLADESGFPFVKICSPDDMVGFTESAKCMKIAKIFDDAYRSMMSCIIVDSLERCVLEVHFQYDKLVLHSSY